MIAHHDARRLGIEHGEAIELANSIGRFRGCAFVADLAVGTLQGHWPEPNVLIPSGVVDRDGGVPDYNALVALVIVERG